MIYTAGFGEKGEEGKRLEQEMVRTVQGSGARIIGPNCIGIYCPSSRLLSFPQGLLQGLPKDSGPVGVVSQSGSFVDLLTWTATAKGIRFSKAVSCGNECDLNAVDFLEYLGADPETKIIVTYLEGVKDGKRFCELARRICKTKPIIVWKAGVTEWGARAAASHTGALTGSSYVWEALFKQVGIISVGSCEEVLDCLYAFYHLPLPEGRRVAIVSGPGGPAVATSDTAIKLGLEVAQLSGETQRRLAEVLPPIGTSIDNPIDLGPGVLLSPQMYGEIIKIVAQDENVDMLLVIAMANRECSESVLEATRAAGKPLVVALTALPEMAPQEYDFLSERGMAVYPDAKRAATALARLEEYARFSSQNFPVWRRYNSSTSLPLGYTPRHRRFAS